MSKIKSIFNNINNKDSRLNIFLYENDKRYISSLQKTGHRFYLPESEELVDGTYQAKGRFASLNFDIIITSHKFDNSFNEVKQMSLQSNAPLIVISHVAPWHFSDNFSCLEDVPKRFMGMLRDSGGDLNITDSKELEESWSQVVSNNLTIPFSLDYNESDFVDTWKQVFNQFKELL